ncbi:DUF3616 domain-containing protein [Azospirillum argentinense]|uniref:DUF3616 domain-containing protein n=1 Tax=Azospirillum argentinense TaxID=2970906 RepID=A0A5B0L0E8_9PROT|nr:DUF3616 domain-containing protein [Azospirillum argentinense]KAA1058332.1 hypothetical protein FH063_000532 [Azospirillum argentinense]
MPSDAAHPIASPIATVRLVFRDGGETAGDLSVAERAGNTLFVASDEGARVVRMMAEEGGTLYRQDAAFPLAEVFTLPVTAPGEDEADIEGMAIAGGWLWVTGSHALARKKPERDENSTEKALERLTEVRCDPNRFLLGRIPLVTEADGRLTPVRRDGKRTAGCLKFRKGGNALTKALAEDEHLARFVAVPAKENGFDVEGMAAHGDRVWLGLRGPVLRGWACILELAVEDHPDVEERLRLRPIGPNGEKYRKHFVDLDGLGIRELTFDGEDLVILAGPTMDLDGPVAVWRWTDALSVTHETVIPRDRLVPLLNLPYGKGDDHAEGIACVRRDGAPPALLVVYDSPSKARRHGAGTTADLFALPSRYDPANAFRA